MNIRRATRPQTYTNIDNSVICDTRLSSSALGVLIYLLSKPDNWTAIKNEILNRFETKKNKLSLNGLNNCFKELRSAGYAEIKPVMKKDKQGKMYFSGSEYVIFDTSILPGCKDIRRPEDLQRPEDLGGSEILEAPKSLGVNIITTDFNLITTDSNLINTDSVNKLPPQAQPEKLKAEKAKTKVSTKNKTLNLQTKLGETLNEQPNNLKVPYFSEFSEIMAHLTKATGKKFRLGKTTSQIKKSDKYLKIVARLKENYTVTDFYNVIGIKCKEWLEDAKMRRFLRPSTLFAAKNFEKYLDEYENKPKTIINYENYQNQPTNNSRRANRRNGAISQEFSENIENSLKAFYNRTNGDSNGANY